MISLYGVLNGPKLIYQSQEMEKAQYVATKESADFVRVYIYTGAELTTFNLEPSTLEETTEYINRLVATANYLKEELLEARSDLANQITQNSYLRRLVDKFHKREPTNYERDQIAREVGAM